MKNNYPKKYLVNTGIGLQQVDGLKPSKYYLDLTNKYINNQINIEELTSLISKYYEQKKEYKLSDKEADIVSNRITNILLDDSFVFSPIQLINIHKYLFNDIFDYSGKIRTTNILKHEWVLNGDSVNYCNFNDIEATLKYDFDLEQKFDYSNLSKQDLLEHLSTFVSNIWQIHMFREGNTRTIAVFLIKYLRYLGFDIVNDIFSDKSWYFRNALVRANYANIQNGIHENKQYLINFLDNLIFNANHELKNRFMHINFNLDNISNLKPNEKALLKLLIANNKIIVEELSLQLKLSVRTIKYLFTSLKQKKIIKRIGGKKLGYWKVNIYSEK